MTTQIDPAYGFETIVENTIDALIGADPHGRIILFNPAAEQMFQRDAKELVDKGLDCLMPERFRNGHKGLVEGYFKSGQESGLLGKVRRMVGMRSDGSEFPIELSLARAPGDTAPFVLAIIRDISKRVNAEQALQKSEQRYARAVHGSQEGIWDWDLVENTVYYAPRWKQLLGIPNDGIGDTPDEWFLRILPSSLKRLRQAIDDHINRVTATIDVELRMRHADGEIRWMLCRGVAAWDDQNRPISLSGSLTDITQLKSAQEQLRHHCEHDRLTGLASRAVLSARLTTALEKTRQDPGHHVALLFFDFDRFKHVNDGLGHGVGDALLISIAQRLKDHVGRLDVVSRFGGDEFVVLLDGVEDLDEVVQRCDKLLAALAQPHHIQGYEIVSTASIGVATSQHGYVNPDEMIRDADAAMYQAKSAGKNRYQFFDQTMHATALQRFEIEQDLQRLPFEQEFCLHYQPIISLESGQLAGFEALVRWDHPHQGLLYPDRFISVAEETGLIVPLGRWVLLEACQQMALWRKRISEDQSFFINVNISKRQLAHPGLIASLRDVLKQSGVRPEDLKLEITESAVMDDRQNMIPIMHDILEMGVHLAMDDFGTGQSSLSCLHRFPIDMLKIDRSFIVNMEQRREFTAVVQSIIMLAKNLNMCVTAEGIETPGQLAQLQSLDCDFAQGYLFSKPICRDDATVAVLKNLPRTA